MLNHGRPKTLLYSALQDKLGQGVLDVQVLKIIYAQNVNAAHKMEAHLAPRILQYTSLQLSSIRAAQMCDHPSA